LQKNLLEGIALGEDEGVCGAVKISRAVVQSCSRAVVQSGYVDFFGLWFRRYFIRDAIPLFTLYS
jgi:hypothetical protein